MSAKKPNYRRVVDAVRSMVESGSLAPGDKLPTKRELMAQYGVSQHAVDMAMLVLREAGLIEGHQGKGVYVAERPEPGGPDAESTS